VVTTQVNTFTYPDTLVVWRPTGTPANPTGLPLYSELVIYCPHPTIPNQFVEMTAPTNTQTVPAATDQAGWQTALAKPKDKRKHEVDCADHAVAHLFHDRHGHAESSRRR